MLEEKRAHPRLLLPLQARVVLSGEERLATLEDLSAGGAGLRLTEEIATGTELDALSFTLAGNGEMSDCEVTTRAQVVYSEQLQQSDGEGGFRAGIRFLDLSEELHRRIQQFIYLTLTKGRPQAEEMPLERRRVTLHRPVSIRFDRFDEFVDEVSENVSMSGMFIRTNDPKSPGTVFDFSFQLGDDFALVEGRAEVVWTRRKTLDAERPAGMGVRFFDIDDRSRNVIKSLVEKSTDQKGAAKPATSKIHVAAVLPKTPPAAATGEKVATVRQELARRTKAYEGRIGELEERIAQLTANQVDVETERRKFESSAAELRNLNDLLEKRLAEAQSLHGNESQDLRQQTEAADRELKELREEVQARKEEAQARRRKTGGLENRLLAVEQALRHAEVERDELSARVKEGVQLRHELENKIEGLESGEEASKHEDLRHQLEETLNRSTVLEDRLAVAERERDEVLEKIPQLESLEETHRLASEKAGGERQQLQSALDETRAELARAQGERERDRTELHRKVEEAEASRSALEEELERVREELETRLSEKVAEVRSVATGLEDQLVHLEASLENEVRSRHAVEESLRRAEDEIERSIGDHQELETGLRQEAMTAVAAAEGAKSSVEHLETSLAESKRDRRQLEIDLEASREEIDQLQEESERRELELRRQADEAVASGEELTARVAALEISLEDSETSRQDLTNQIEALKARSLKAEESYTGSRTELEQLRAETDSRISDLDGELTEARTSESALEETVLQLEAQLADARRDAEKLEESARASEDSLRTEVEAERAAAADLEGELDRVRVEMLEHKEHARESNEELRGELDRARAQAEERIGELEGLLAEAGESESVREEKISYLEALVSDAEKHARELEEGARVIESDLRAEVEAERAEISKLEGELDGVRAAEGSVREDLEHSRSVIEALQSELEGAQAETLEIKEQARSAENELQHELEESTSTMLALQEKLANLESSAQAEEEKSASLAADLEQAQADRGALAEEVTTLRAAVTGLKVELERRDPDVDVQSIITESTTTEPRSKGRWVRAAGLIAAGLMAGVLLVGPGARLLPFDPERWLAGNGEVESVAGGGAQAVVEETTAPEAEQAGSPSETLAAEANADQEGGLTSEPPEPAYPAVADVVNAWASAWADQRVEDYLWFYSSGFAPPNGASRPAWEAYRRERLEAPDSIEITLANLTQQNLDADRTRVTFEQAYKAGGYSDLVLKTLVMVREDGSWKILSELSEVL